MRKLTGYIFVLVLLCTYTGYAQDTDTSDVDLPYPIESGAALIDPNDSGSLLLIGGHNETSTIESVVRLELDNSDLTTHKITNIDENGLQVIGGQWKILPQKLAKDRMSHFAMYIPDHLVHCK